ncbi:hypothetical protein F0562_012079 [Nyssa sinensis]|uniref:Uncharacterized protein n=1 Tax=Nyssa sinensis TaxID=561372 RepID=A0A5J4ZTM0_9ASTE|nr:hypothetical protein F0562_012079 [Nyssa sinensis]
MSQSIRRLEWEWQRREKQWLKMVEGGIKTCSRGSDQLWRTEKWLSAVTKEIQDRRWPRSRQGWDCLFSYWQIIRLCTGWVEIEGCMNTELVKRPVHGDEEVLMCAPLATMAAAEGQVVQHAMQKNRQAQVRLGFLRKIGGVSRYLGVSCQGYKGKFMQLFEEIVHINGLERNAGSKKIGETSKEVV